MNDIILKKALNDYTIIEIIEKTFTNLSKNSQVVYAQSINQFLKYFSISLAEIKQITFADIQDYFNHLKSKYAPATSNLKLTAIRNLFKRLKVLFKIDNPFSILKAMDIKLNQSTSSKVDKDKCLTEKDLIILLSHYSKKMQSSNKRTQFTAKRNHLLLKLLCQHGTRISETLDICHSDISKVNDDQYNIELRITKNKKKRIIKIGNQIYNEIKALSNEGYILQSLNGKRLNRSFVYKELNRVGGRLLQKQVGCHIFRHSFATIYYQKTKDLIGLSDYLGHESGTAFTSKQYVHNTIDINNLKTMRLQA